MVPLIKQIMCTSTREGGETLFKIWGSIIRITYSSRWKVTSPWWPPRTANSCG